MKDRWHIITTFAILLIATVFFGACTARKNPVSKTITGGGTSTQEGNSITGVIVEKDTENTRISIRELDTDVVSNLHYDGSSSITDQYGQEVTGEDLDVGLIVKAAYRPEDASLVSLEVPKDVWEYSEEDDFIFRAEEHMLCFAEKKFQYSEELTYVSSQGQPITLGEINMADVLTVRGVGYKVYSIVQTGGHGYIRLTGYQDFLGGILGVGNQSVLKVTENMFITAPEGEVTLTISKGANVASKTVEVSKNQEIEADFSDYVPMVKNVGMITFAIEPHGADLTINGTAVDYSKPVALNYGEYKIAVSLTGYDSYTGILDVEDAARTVSIDLIETTASVATASPAPEDGTEGTEEKGKTAVDSEHTITISGPRGAEVYLDNVYKGMAPCKFTKVTGTQTLTLRKAGCVTKSYTISVEDNDENVSYEFAELVAKEDSTSDQ